MFSELLNSTYQPDNNKLASLIDTPQKGLSEAIFNSGVIFRDYQRSSLPKRIKAITDSRNQNHFRKNRENRYVASISSFVINSFIDFTSCKSIYA